MTEPLNHHEALVFVMVASSGITATPQVGKALNLGEARRIASNIAKLPHLLAKGD
jgi:hypothetical protein